MRDAFTGFDVTIVERDAVQGDDGGLDPFGRQFGRGVGQGGVEGAGTQAAGNDEDGGHGCSPSWAQMACTPLLAATRL